LELLKIETKPYAQASTLPKKAQRLWEKVLIIFAFLFHYATNRIKSSRLYITVDDYVHIDNRIDDAVYLTMLGYTFFRENLLNPTVNFIKVNNDLIKQRLRVTFSGLNLDEVK